MKKIFRLLLVFSLPAILLLMSNCRKDQFGKSNLTFNTDTLTFDTVFTSLGSTTKYFKVFNKDKKAIKISNIHLMHLVGTQFRISVDGMQGDNFNEVEIPAKDSIYVFVEVTVNPTNAMTPFLLIDDVQFTLNENVSTVHLQAFGQNAHFHYGQIISGNQIWSNDLPHVVISHDTVPGVYVKCGGSLTIQPGCKVFFAGNSALFVEGRLTANATTWNDSIIFRGVRLEQYYDGKPGQWFGIVFLRNGCGKPKGSFEHCVINESSYGIYAGAGLTTNLADYLGDATRPDVTIKNSIVTNSLYNAVYGFNANIKAENSIFYAAGEYLVKFGLGGIYNFNQCTLYNGGSRFVDHQKESLFLSNLVSDGTNTYLEPLKTTFTNCVVYGSLQNEVSFNNAEDTSFINFDNTFSYCHVKTKQDTFEMFTKVHDNVLFNQEPRFEKAEEGNFTPSDSAGFFSPLIDYAPSAALFIDIFDKSRPVLKTNNQNKFDVGAVEAP